MYMYLLHAISLCTLLRGLQHRTCTTFADLKMRFWSIRTVGAMNPASRRIHRSVLGPYPKSQSWSTNQVRDRETRAARVAAARTRSQAGATPRSRPRAIARAGPRGVFSRALARTSIQIGSQKVAECMECIKLPQIDGWFGLSRPNLVKMCSILSRD